jgi:hypothetical protein
MQKVQWRARRLGLLMRAVTAILLTAALSGCSDVLEPVKGLGDALRGMFEGLF